MPFAVNVVDVAIPEAFVVAVDVEIPPANVPLAPLVGAVNVTSIPETAAPPAAVTIVSSGFGNALLIGSVWPDPDIAATLVGI